MSEDGATVLTRRAASAIAGVRVSKITWFVADSWSDGSGRYSLCHPCDPRIRISMVETPDGDEIYYDGIVEASDV